VKTLVIDDHTLIREALRGLFGQLNPDTVLLEASDCAEAMCLVEQHPDLDLILLDLTLPDRDGFSMLAELREYHPTTAVVVLSGSNERHDVNRALELGAVGYIPKTTSHDVMLSALKLIFAGGIYIPPEILDRELSPTDGDTALHSPTALGLTERQTEVLALLAQGKCNKAIGRTLGLAEPTIKNHVTAIFKALKVTRRTEAIIAIQKLRLKLPQHMPGIGGAADLS
jgi:DNA-binding NarL/FixJ family response regulator